MYHHMLPHCCSLENHSLINQGISGPYEVAGWHKTFTVIN